MNFEARVRPRTDTHTDDVTSDQTWPDDTRADGLGRICFRNRKCFTRAMCPQLALVLTMKSTRDHTSVVVAEDGKVFMKGLYTYNGFLIRCCYIGCHFVFLFAPSL